MARKQAPPAASPPRITRIEVRNYRALRSVVLDDITPLTALLGPNGSGKSTLFDVFSFLSECFTGGLRNAWDKRGRFRELRTRGTTGPIVFDLTYREHASEQPATYHLAIDEGPSGPIVVEEWLKWRRVAKNAAGAPYRILSFKNGRGWVISGKHPDRTDFKVPEELDTPDLLAVSTLGQLARNSRVAALRRFVTDWYVSYLSVDESRGQPDAGAQERLSKNGDNLANVIQYLKERHPARLQQIFESLKERIPRLEKVDSVPMPNGQLLLTFKDAPFTEPILARFASDGTLKMLAYLVVLHDPQPPPFIGIEEPENFLHPNLLPRLAEECRAASEAAQVLVTTHSPFLLNALRPEEVRVLFRDDQGFTQTLRASAVVGVREFMAAGASLGDLWMEGHFGAGDPLVASGGPTSSSK